MKDNASSRRWRGVPLGRVATVTALLLLACSESHHGDGPAAADSDTGQSPFKSLAAVANAPSTFSSPRAGVPLADGSIAFIATLEDRDESELSESGERVAVLLQAASGGAPRVLYSGDALANPLDLALSVDGKLLYVADPAAGAEGLGALLALGVDGGEPSEIIHGLRPRAVTTAEDGALYFSGVSDDGSAAVFQVTGATASSVYSGLPLVDPSGIAVQSDGTLLVAETRLLDADSTVASEAGIVRIKDGGASVIATGFATGYPAGIALTLDEKVLLVSGEGPDRSDTVYLIDMANPGAAPRAIRDTFSAYQDSSAGLKRAHDSNTFVWASLAADGGTVFRIEAR